MLKMLLQLCYMEVYVTEAKLIKNTERSSPRRDETSM
jgi:hypothetical protein